MSEQPPPRPAVVLSSVDGSAASDDGTRISLTVTLQNGQQVDVTIPVDRATDMMLLVGQALGGAKQRATGDPSFKYQWPARSYEVAPQMDGQHVTLALRLSTGNELCFQLDLNGAQGLGEGLLATLGRLRTDIPPGSRRH